MTVLVKPTCPEKRHAIHVQGRLEFSEGASAKWIFDVGIVKLKTQFFRGSPGGGSSAIYGREAGVALTGMKKQRRDRGW